jgi:hypothetical protein
MESFFPAFVVQALPTTTLATFNDWLSFGDPRVKGWFLMNPVCCGLIINKSIFGLRAAASSLISDMVSAWI